MPNQPKKTVKERLLTLWRSWATRSLAIGALATGIDIGIGEALLKLTPISVRFAAMVGVAFGATFTYFANKMFAFKDKGAVGKSAWRFILATAAAMVIHGQFVSMLVNGLKVPYVPSKMIADVAVFSLGQLFVLRYLVFPKSKPHDEPKKDDKNEPFGPRDSLVLR